MSNYFAKQRQICSALFLVLCLHISASFAEGSALDESTTWPMQAGESINDLARLFYPHNKPMQRQFSMAAIKLNHDHYPELLAAKPFEQETLILIPDIKALSKYGKPKVATVVLESPSVNNMPAMTAKQQVDYDHLLVRNALFKTELDKLNLQLSHLQQVFSVLKTDLIQILERVATMSSTQNSNTVSALQAPVVTEAAPSAPPASATAMPKVDVSAEAVLSRSAQTSYLYLIFPIVTTLLVIGIFVALALYTRRKTALLSSLAAGETISPLGKEIYEPDVLDVNALSKDESIQQIKEALAPIDVADFEVKHEEVSEAALANAHTSESDNQGVGEELAPLTLADFEDQEAVLKGYSVQEVDAQESALLGDLEAPNMLLIEQAKIYESLGRSDDAISLLKTYIKDSPKTALPHRLYLLEIYRNTNQKEAFSELAKELHEAFNVVIPAWEKLEGATVPMNNADLEAHAHIIGKVTKLWAECSKETHKISEAKRYLDHLLTDNRDGQREGFSTEAFEEIMLLRNTLDAQEKLAQED